MALNRNKNLKDQHSHYEPLANRPFPGGYPSKESIQELKDELVFQRAVQCYLWALPVLNMYGMKDGSRTTSRKSSSFHHPFIPSTE
jgi:hypothetical protein